MLPTPKPQPRVARKSNDNQMSPEEDKRILTYQSRSGESRSFKDRWRLALGWISFGCLVVIALDTCAGIQWHIGLPAIPSLLALALGFGSSLGCVIRGKWSSPAAWLGFVIWVLLVLVVLLAPLMGR